MPVGFIRFDLRNRLSLKLKKSEVTDPNQYFYQYDSQTFSEGLQSGHAEILSVFPAPIWNVELNIFMTICINVL